MNKMDDIFLKIEKENFQDGLPKEYEDLTHNVVTDLKKNKLSITAAESLTSGMFQSTIAEVPGASNVFSGGFVTYSDEVKTKLLGVAPGLIKQYTVVSAPVAQEMALRSAQILTADIGVGLTGVAGPDALEGSPVGTVFIGVINRRNDKKIVKEFHFEGSRNAIRIKSVVAALFLIKELI